MMSHLRNAASPLNIGRRLHPPLGESMRDVQRNRSVLAAVLSDLQFWVPVAVLAGGLIVLHWIS